MYCVVDFMTVDDRLLNANDEASSFYERSLGRKISSFLRELVLGSMGDFDGQMRELGKYVVK